MHLPCYGMSNVTLPRAIPSQTEHGKNKKEKKNY